MSLPHGAHTVNTQTDDFLDSEAKHSKSSKTPGFSQNNPLNSAELLTSRNDRRASCFSMDFPQHIQYKPWGWLWLSEHSQAKAPWSSRAPKSAYETDCGHDLRLRVHLWYNQDAPYAQAVKCTLLYSAEFKRGIWSHERAENILPGFTFLSDFINHHFKVKPL